MKLRTLVAAALAFTATLTPATANATSIPATHFGPATTWSYENDDIAERVLRPADVDGDGKTDLVFSDFSGNTWVSRATGASFLPSEQWVTDNPVNATADMADVNGDGKADAIYKAADSYYVRLSTGKGFGPLNRWSQPRDSTESLYPATRMAADMNGDGFADLVTVDYQNTRDLHVWLSDGTRFLPPTTWWPALDNGDHAVHLCDVDADGLADVVIFADNGVRVFRSDGTTLLQPETWSPAVSHTPGGAEECQDVTGDGKADVIVVTDQGTYVHPSDGHQFLPAQDWTSGPFFSYNYNFFGDVNADGKADAITTRYQPYSLTQVRLAQ